MCMQFILLHTVCKSVTEYVWECLRVYTLIRQMCVCDVVQGQTLSPDAWLPVSWPS